MDFWIWNVPNAPDGRLTGPKGRELAFTIHGLRMEKVFCGGCGCDGGAVPATNVPYVFYLCDKCAPIYGRIDMVELPDDIVRSTEMTWL